MATTTATLDLPIWRNDDVYELPLRVIGPNLTGVPIRAQIRRAGDEPGPALVSLELVAAGEGIRLASVTSVDGVWQNDLRIRINTATRQALGYAGVPGASQMLRWGLKIAGITRIQGQVILPPHVMDSDNAPEVFDAPYGYARQAEVSSAPIDGATLMIAADNVVQLTIDGADLVERAAGLSKDSADRSETKANAAAADAFKSSLYASTAITAIGGVMYPTTNAGLAAASAPQFFTVTGDNAATYAVLYERGGNGAKYDFTQEALPQGVTLARAAGPWTRVKPDKTMEIGTAANVPRFDYDPVSGTLRGLLVEPSRTNFAPKSDASILTLSEVVLVANVGAALDGTQTADRVVPSTVNNRHSSYVFGQYGVGSFTFSAVVKADGYPRLGMRVYDGVAYRIRNTIDLSTGTVVSIEAGTLSIQAVGNGRYLVSGSGTGAGNNNLGNSSGGGWVLETLPGTVVVQGGFAGDGVSGMLVSDIQIEPGLSVTSRIPTTGAAATRPADVLTLDWGRLGAADGVVNVRYTFDDNSVQNATMTVANGKATVDPTMLNRFCIRSVTLVTAVAPVAIERSRYASKAAYEGAGGAALIGTNRGALDRRLDSLALYARDFGVVGDAASDANGNIIGTDDTAAVQAFQNLCAALNRIAYYGSLRPRLTGPVTIHNGSCVFDRQSFTATGESAGVSRGEPAFYVSGANYTALTVSGICTEFRVTVCGSGDATTDAAGNITADTRPNIRAFQFGNPLGAANGTLILSHIGWARATKLAGKALAVVNAFDCIFGPLLTEGCGNAADYGFAIEDGGNTTNECVFTYIQAEFGKQKALYISPNLVSCTFLKIHSERATSKDGVPAWVLGPAAYSSVRLNSMNRLGRCEIVAQYGKITGLKPENVRVAVNSTGGTFSIEDGQFSQGIEAASGSNGMVSLTSCSGYYHNVTQNWYLNKCAAEEVNVGACPDGYWPVLDHCRVNALRRTDDTAAVEVCGGRVEALRDGQWREIRITTNARVALEGGARSLSQCKLTLDATSKIVGNLILTTVGFRFAGRIEGNLTLQGIRQTLFAASAEVTGTATNVGPPEGDSYLDGSPDGTWCKNIRPVILGAALASYTINDTSGVPRTITTGGRYTIPAWIKTGGVWTPQTAATGT